MVRPVERWRHGHVTREDDCIAEEVPVAMVYNGATFAVMMATPHDLDDFALGFSLSESLIDDPAQLLQLDQQALLEGIELAMQVSEDAHGAHIGRERERLLPGRSGCGICGTRELGTGDPATPTGGRRPHAHARCPGARATGTACTATDE